MELIQIFDRTTGQWSEKYRLRPAYAENWVLDKTTDKGTDFIFRVPGLEEPKWSVADWVRVMHVDSEDDAAAYTAEGLPDNHTQYIIGAIDCKQNALLEKWVVTVSLIETIERTRGILGETLSFTNQTSKTVNIDGSDITFVKDRYNHYTALRRWLMVTPANCDAYNENLDPARYGIRGVGTGDVLNDVTFAAPLDGLMFEETHVPVLWFDDGTILASWTEDENDPSARGVGIGTPVLDSWDGTGYVYLANVTMVTSGASLATSYNFNGRKVSQIVQEYIREAIHVTAENISWYNRIKILDRDWLATLPFDDTTYNELTLYNVLMDNYDSSTGRTPVMYFDIDPATDLPRNLDRDEYLLKFERQDGFDKPILEWDALRANSMDLSLSRAANNYATGLVSNITNLSAGNIVEFPAQSLYAVPEVIVDTARDTTGYDAPGTNHWGIVFPHGIKRILNVQKVDLDGGKGTQGSLSAVELKRTNVSLTNLVVEQKQYLSAQTEPDADQSALWYQEGDNVLYIRSYYYNEDQITAMYYIEYDALINCRLVVGREDFAAQVNQSASQVDASKYADFLRAYLKGMNKADIVFGKTYYDFNDFKDHIGCRVKRGDKTYMITNVSYRNRNLQYDVFYQLNENHMRKNANYQAAMEVRADLDIASDNIKERMISIKQTVKLGLTPQASEGYQFLTDKKAALSALIPHSVDSSKYPQVARIKFKSRLSASGSYVEYELKRLASVAKFRFGNQVAINIKFADNATAAKSKTGVISFRGGRELFTDVSSQLPVLYTDPFGETEKVDILIASLSPQPLEDVNITWTSDAAAIAEFDRTAKVCRTMAELPVIADATWNEIASNVTMSIEGQQICKDQLENFNVTPAVEYVSAQANVIIADKLISLSRLMRANDAQGGVPGERWIRLYGYYTEKSLTDSLIDSGKIVVEPKSLVWGSDYVEYSEFIGSFNSSYKSIVVYDVSAGGGALLIINNPDAAVRNDVANGKLRVYFA